MTASSLRALVIALMVVAGCSATETDPGPAQPAAAPVDREAPSTSSDKASPPQPMRQADAPGSAKPQQSTSADTPENSKTPQPADADRCTAMCAPTVALKCGDLAACMTGCAQMSAAGLCPTELSHFVDCATRQPIESWECGGAAVAVMRPGHCDAEQAAFARCAQAAATGVR